jgi:hypothetical protein
VSFVIERTSYRGCPPKKSPSRSSGKSTGLLAILQSTMDSSSDLMLERAVAALERGIAERD